MRFEFSAHRIIVFILLIFKWSIFGWMHGIRHMLQYFECDYEFIATYFGFVSHEELNIHIIILVLDNGQYPFPLLTYYQFML